MHYCTSNLVFTIHQSRAGLPWVHVWYPHFAKALLCNAGYISHGIVHTLFQNSAFGVICKFLILCHSMHSIIMRQHLLPYMSLMYLVQQSYAVIFLAQTRCTRCTIHFAPGPTHWCKCVTICVIFLHRKCFGTIFSPHKVYNFPTKTYTLRCKFVQWPYCSCSQVCKTSLSPNRSCLLAFVC